MSNKNDVRRQKKNHAKKVARNSRHAARKAQGLSGFDNRAYARRKHQEEMRIFARAAAIIATREQE